MAVLAAALLLSAIACFPLSCASFRPDPTVVSSQGSSYRMKRPSGMISVSASSGADPSTTNIRVLGVCGGIGSGKSTACKILVSELNCLAHVDADSIAHTVYEPGSRAVDDVVKAFGSQVLLENSCPDEIDRKKLGAIVFSDRQAMTKLERLVWPHVETEIQSRIDKLKQDFVNDDRTSVAVSVIVVEAAVLLDADWEQWLDGVWVVTTPKETATARLMETRGLSLEEADERIQAQQSRRGIGNLAQEVENNIVTATIENSGSLDDLKAALLQRLSDAKAWKV